VLPLPHDLDCATSSPRTVVPSYERPSSLSLFVPTTMTESRSPTASQKRPKLSLQTSSLPITFGKSSTALALAASAIPTASPTILNTFNNAYDLPHRSSPATASPTGSRFARSRLVSPFTLSKEERPYQISLGLKSILRNSPVLSGLRRPSLCHAGDSPRAGRRAFFPAPKKVTFRLVLEEEIRTNTYTAKHSDLSSDEEESDSDGSAELSISSSEESDTEERTLANAEKAPTERRRKRKAGSDRQIQAAAIRDGLVDAKRIQQRVKPIFELRRKRRRRHWEWTIEPSKETLPETATTLQVQDTDLSPSQVPLPLSAASNRAEAISSSLAPSPLAFTFTSRNDGIVESSPSTSPFYKQLLPAAATSLPPASSRSGTEADDEMSSLASKPPRAQG
jgi:hypothetical protein